MNSAIFIDGSIEKFKHLIISKIFRTLVRRCFIELNAQVVCQDEFDRG